MYLEVNSSLSVNADTDQFHSGKAQTPPSPAGLLKKIATTKLSRFARNQSPELLLKDLKKSQPAHPATIRDEPNL
jgi:hypothetical protein